ncbi:TetR/AcrR family transcriptional regulator [uncultured Robinsoniella sp.]|uniref:TetR/AcrR family transcriptional regulator n=1 Tax=uncultured Robinsoniella sp. TaxID=904190 RepID=UPI00374E38B2
MKRELKTLQSREKILHAAIEEFGRNGYDNASLNAALAQSGISKGLVYHYFKNKDELYLSCVKSCFDALMECLKTDCTKSSQPNLGLEAYLDARQRFFKENPLFIRIFFNAVIQPPSHLKTDIEVLKKDFDQFNLKIFESALSGLTLRRGISMEDATSYFTAVQELFHQQCFKDFTDCDNGNNFIMIHEEKVRTSLDMILYGIAEEDKL